MKSSWNHPKIRQTEWQAPIGKNEYYEIEKKLETEIEMLNDAKKTEASPQAGPVNYDCSNLYHCDNKNIK